MPAYGIRSVLTLPTPHFFLSFFFLGLKSCDCQLPTADILYLGTLKKVTGQGLNCRHPEVTTTGVLLTYPSLLATFDTNSNKVSLVVA